MTQNTAEKAPPTLQELEGKVQRLTTQVANDAKAKATADEQFTRAVKSQDVDLAIAAGDARSATRATLAKSESQLKTAQGAVTSAKYAVNADKIVALHEQVRTNKELGLEFVELEKYGVTKLTIERAEESGKLIINSAGPNVKKPRASGSGGGGNRGTASWEVDGQSFTSRELIDAHPDLLTDKVREHYESGNFRAFSMTREAERIHEKLTSGN